MHIYFELSICLYISSPYLLVFGDDRVIHYTGADDVVGDSSEAYIRVGQHGDFKILAHFSFHHLVL